MQINQISIRNVNLIESLASLPGCPPLISRRNGDETEIFADFIKEFETNSELEAYLKFLIWHLSGAGRVE